MNLSDQMEAAKEADCAAGEALKVRVGAVEQWRRHKTDANKAAYLEATTIHNGLEERADQLWVLAYDPQPITDPTPEHVENRRVLQATFDTANEASVISTRAFNTWSADRTDINKMVMDEAMAAHNEWSAEAARMWAVNYRRADISGV